MSCLCYVVMIAAFLVLLSSDPTSFIIIIGGVLGVYLALKLLKDKKDDSSKDLKDLLQRNYNSSSSFLTELISKEDLLKKISRFLTFVGTFWGLFYYIDIFWGINDVVVFLESHHFSFIFYHFVGILISGVGLYMLAKPDHPIPWHWVSLFCLGGLMIFFLFPIGGMFILGGALVEFIDSAPSTQTKQEEST